MQKSVISELIAKIQGDVLCDHMDGVEMWDKETLMEFLEEAEMKEKAMVVQARTTAPMTSGDYMLDLKEAESYYAKLKE